MHYRDDDYYLEFNLFGGDDILYKKFYLRVYIIFIKVS